MSTWVAISAARYWEVAVKSLFSGTNLGIDLDLDRDFLGDNEGVDDLDWLRRRTFGPGR